MSWKGFEEGLSIAADIAGILTFLGLGYFGIKIGRFIKKWGLQNLKERIRMFLIGE